MLFEKRRDLRSDGIAQIVAPENELGRRTSAAKGLVHLLVLFLRLKHERVRMLEVMEERLRPEHAEPGETVERCLPRNEREAERILRKPLDVVEIEELREKKVQPGRVTVEVVYVRNKASPNAPRPVQMLELVRVVATRLDKRKPQKKECEHEQNGDGGKDENGSVGSFHGRGVRIVAQRHVGVKRAPLA